MIPPAVAAAPLPVSTGKLICVFDQGAERAVHGVALASSPSFNKGGLSTRLGEHWGQKFRTLMESSCKPCPPVPPPPPGTATPLPLCSALGFCRCSPEGVD
eukprot:5135796-Pyramimonas_sp.AAC.1